jgi:hypothetical protein
MKLGSVGDVLGQIQVESIEKLLSRPVSDLQRAIAEADAQIDNELNRASDPRVRSQIGEGGEDAEEFERAQVAVQKERERGVALDVFLQRAVVAAGGSVERREDGMRVVTPSTWRSSEVHDVYEELLPPGSFRPNENVTPEDVLHEEHPLIEAAVRWVRASRFRKDDDHRLACALVPDLSEPDLIATFMISLQDGNGAEFARVEAVRLKNNLQVSENALDDDAATREVYPGNMPVELIAKIFGS